jgi:hypothetical protein
VGLRVSEGVWVMGKTKILENSCASWKSGAILTGSADEKRYGFTRNCQMRVVKKYFKKYLQQAKNRCILQGFADRSKLLK